MYLFGFIPPQPDTKSPTNALTGFLKRAGGLTPPPDHAILEEIALFIPKFLEKNGVCKIDKIMSFSEWIEDTNYSRGRKDQLIDLEKSQENLSIMEVCESFNDANKVKCFVKYEHYPEYKYPRGIYSRGDRLKCKFGPVFKTIEKEMFKLKYFIKKVPVHDRPRYLNDLFVGWEGFAVASDYSSFEGSFGPENMLKIEYLVYKYIAPFCSEIDTIMELLTGNNKLRFKHFSAKITATRMSGEMNTSLGNSVTNLIVLAFLCHKNGTDFTGVVEGDDGLFKFTHWNRRPTSEQFAQLGFKIKLVECEKHNEASFCGLVYDDKNFVNVTDPFYLLAKFGFADKKYLKSKDNIKKQLLRCKAFSLAYQYGQCPVLGRFAERVLYLTRNETISKKIVDAMSVYDKEEFESIDETAIKFGVHDETRFMFEKLYGIDFNTQLLLEKKISTIELGVFFMEEIAALFPPTFKHFFEHYFLPHPPSYDQHKKYDDIFLRKMMGRRPLWWGS